MKRNVCRILGCFLFAFILCIMTPSFAKASVKNIPQTKTSGTYAGNVDITGDGNADSVIIRTTVQHPIKKAGISTVLRSI